MSFFDDVDPDELPYIEPIYDLFTPFHGPLTADDIARIERGINVLVANLFSSAGPERVEEELAAPLQDKIDGYIGIADHVAENDELNIEPALKQLLQQRLRELLQKVNDYYHKLN